MRITLLTLGTRGDVQPAVARAMALQGAGHSVTLAIPGEQIRAEDGLVQALAVILKTAGPAP